MTINEDRAKKIGQDAQYHDVNDLHDAEYGSYQNGQGIEKVRGGAGDSPSTVMPMSINSNPATKVRGT